MPYRQQNSNKGTFGKVLNFAGSKNYVGAAYLSTISSLKVGCGLIALASTSEVLKSVQHILPEAVYLHYKDGIKKIKDYDVCMIGCGLGTENNSVNLLKKVLKNNSNKPFIIDADGLNIIAKHKLTIPQNSIITPHPLEASRLLDCNLSDILENMEQAAKHLVQKYNCVVVLKSNRTIICDNTHFFTNQHGNSALAKAGSGDVLSGIIAGLVAQKMELFDAAKLGVYLHSRAGEIASEYLTEYSVLATDIIKYLPKAIAEI